MDRLRRFRHRQQGAALLEECVDAGGAELRSRQQCRRDGAAQPESAQRREQLRQTDGGGGGREQAVLPEPGELFDSGDGGQAVGRRGAVRGDDGATAGRKQRHRPAVELDLAAEDGEIDTLEAVLFDPGDEGRAVEPFGQRADHRLVEREQAKVRAEAGSLGEALGDLLAGQRDRMHQRDATQA